MNPNDISRLVLGTAQLGMHYGIANNTGAPTKAEAFQILEYAWESGIRRFDTAPGYQSEPIIGEFVRAHRLGGEINLLTKIPSIGESNDWQEVVQSSIAASFKELGVDKIEVLFFHNPKDAFLLFDHADFFKKIMAAFPIEALGVSVYEPHEVERMHGCGFELAFQFPFNMLDRRFEKNSIALGCRYARSIFLQGVLASEQMRSGAPEPLKKLHDAIWIDGARLGLSLKQVAWTFIRASKCLDYFLIGVEAANQLKDLLQLNAVGMEAIEAFDKVRCTYVSADWLDPRKWK